MSPTPLSVVILSASLPRNLQRELEELGSVRVSIGATHQPRDRHEVDTLYFVCRLAITSLLTMYHFHVLD